MTWFLKQLQVLAIRMDKLSQCQIPTSQSQSLYQPLLMAKMAKEAESQVKAWILIAKMALMLLVTYQ